MPDKGYEFFEHTADVGLRVHGETLPELFCHAAQGTTALLVEDSPLQGSDTRPLRLQAESVAELLHLWLKELLFWFHTDRFLFVEASFDMLTPTELTARVSGDRFTTARHAQGTEIKGVTYHQFQVERSSNGWEAQIIFDV